MFYRSIEAKNSRLLSPIDQEEIRRQAVKAILNGKAQAEVADKFGVTRQAVAKWVKVYRKEGERALGARPKGRPKGAVLLACQETHVARTLLDYYPERLELPFYLWSAEAVAQLIERRYGVRFAMHTVARYLTRWGFAAHSTSRRVSERKPEVLHKRVEEEYLWIKKQAKRERALLYRYNVKGFHTCELKEHPPLRRCGRKPPDSENSLQLGYNMVSAITNRRQLNFIVYKGVFVFETFLDSIKRLAGHSERKVFLIIDWASARRLREIKGWIEKDVLQTHVFFLPKCTPRQCSKESLSQDVKSCAVGQKVGCNY